LPVKLPEYGPAVARAQIDRRNATAWVLWSRKTALNFLLHRLERKGRLKTSYLNIPLQVPRRHVIALDALSPSGLTAGRRLQQVLATPGSIPAPLVWRYDPGTWELLLWQASLVLVSRLLRKTLLTDLLQLRHQDIAQRGWLLLPPACLRSTPPADDMYWRFPLARAAQRRLDALLAILGKHFPSDPNFVFPVEWRERKWRPRLARAWKEAVTHLLGEAERSDVSSLANLATTAKALALLDGLPPFLVAVSAGEPETLISPMTPASFARLGRRQEAQRRFVRRPQPPRRRGARHLPIRLDDGFDWLEQIRKTIKRKASFEARKAIARQLKATLGAQPRLGAYPMEGDSLAYNVWCFGQWLRHLLLRPNLAPGTVLTWSSAVSAHFFPTFQKKPLSLWASDDWIEAARATLEEHQTDASARAIRLFHQFAAEHTYTSTSRIQWSKGDPRRLAPKDPVPLIGFEDFEVALQACDSDAIPGHFQALLRVMLILGFYCGLRSAEAVRLQLRHLILAPEPLLEIRDTKTAHGSRNLYLQRLVPATYLTEVLEFASRRSQRLGRHRQHAVLLGTETRVAAYDSSYLASMAGIALRRAVPESLCFHHLRHSFASWMLLRLFAACGLIEVQAKRWPFAKAEVFQERYHEGLRTLLFGLVPPKEGQQFASHALVVLCRLLGHSHPLTTVTTYCHTVDLAMLLFQRQKGQP
ncbi:MAG: site-specific integrase, partial [Gaiellales bacterium]